MLRTAASALGIFAMIAAIVVGALAAVGVFGDEPTRSRTSGPQPAAAEITRAELTAGVVEKPVTAGDVSWTVTGAHRTSELHKDTPPPETETGNFVVVTFTVENVSEEPVTLTEESVALIDEKGRKFPARAFLNSGYVDPEKNILFNEMSLLEPGVTREGRVNFVVSADASGFKAQLGDADPTVNEERYVDLGF